MNVSKIPIYLTLTILLLINLNLYSQFANPIMIESNTGLITNIETADINNDNLKDIILTKNSQQIALSPTT